ncbi:hypothetical protein [Dietzia sp. PP-33]|jgi:hypothetical protein|uniref:hypothetical protein n=1 Tax=Dietzia sp. PP-33 TaxID=2957500 RepID=UPI0029A67FE5|nr:hypothetical protein [Dietzia sp. PP-33]MDX2357454.1 hypothetical protein [Dietzia sp. PP-33]
MRAFEPHHPKLRIAALVIVAGGAVARGVAYLNQPSTGGLTHFIDALVPLHVWAIVWIAAGVTVLAGIWHRVVGRYALAFVSMMWAIWGLSYMTATVFGDASRGWVTGALILNLAGLTIIVAALADTVGPSREPVKLDLRGDG